MPLDASIPILTLEKANTWAFAAGISEIQINVLRVPAILVKEELAKYTSGLRQHSGIYEFPVKIFPYSTVKSANRPDSGDRLALETWLADDKPMRVKELTVGRYGTNAAKQIASVRAMLIGRHVTQSGYEVSDGDGQTYERATLKLISRFYE
jgi:hypothetical protein